MRVFMTGASGHIASALVPEFLTAGHTVVGLARSDRAAAAIRSRGAEVRRSDLDDVEGLFAAAQEADAVVHLAFKHDEQRSGDFAGAVSADLRAIEAIGAALAGTGKPFVGTNATGAMALAGHMGLLTENDTLPGGPRVDAENAVVGLAESGVRSVVIRLPPTVHGDGVYGFASDLIEVARRAGVSGYCGEGNNRWPSAQVRDVARLYRLALESASAGTRLHAAAEEGIPLRAIARAIGRRLNLPVTVIPVQDADLHFGPMAPFARLDNPTSSEITRSRTDWSPTGADLIADLESDAEASRSNESSAG